MPTQIILHSAVDAPGPTTLHHYFARADVGVESHFFVKLDGTIEQYMDTNVRADANRHANLRAVSIETEDEGNPDQRPWTPAQQDALVKLMDWLCTVHGIPRVKCVSWTAAGIGWHSMWGAPSKWTPAAGKTCPGKARIAQCFDLIRRVAEGGKDQFDMASLDDLRKIVADEGAATREWVKGQLAEMTAVLKAKDVQMRDSLAALARKIDEENDNAK